LREHFPLADPAAVQLFSRALPKMRCDSPALAALLVWLALASSTFAAPQERTVSTSRQFIVHGPDIRLRGAICDIAERTKRAALSLLQTSDAWAIPILIRADFPQAHRPEIPPVQLQISQTGFGLKLQLELLIGHDINPQAIERELLRAILLEMMYRNQPDVPAGTAWVEPPEWLLDGTLALAADEAVAGPLSTISGNVPPLADFLRQRPALLDSPSRALYRACSAALVTMLRDSPDGRVQLRRFIAGLPDSPNDSFAYVRSQFPALGESDEQLQNAWTSAVARLAERRSHHLLNCGETERQLATLLRVGVRKQGQVAITYTLEEWQKFVGRKEAAEGLHHLNQQLLLFSARAHPLYRPVVEEYQKIVLNLSRKKTGRMGERLAELRGLREHIQRRMGAIDDYLNWFEATQSRTVSGEFRDYMRAAELAQERQTRRRDPISVYLDALEVQVGN
jgi:hypothetical protein